MKKDKLSRKDLLGEFYRGNRLAFSITLGCAFFAGGLNLAASWLIQQLIDTISGVSGARSLGTLVVITGILIGLVLVFGMVEYCAKPRFMKRAMEQYKDYVFGKLLEKNINAFRQEETAGYLSALTNDMKNIEENYLEKQFGLVSSAVMFGGAFIMMLIYSPLLTAIAILLTLLPVLVSALAGNKLERAELLVSDHNEGFVGILKECVTGFSVIKSFGAQQVIGLLFSRRNTAVEEAKSSRNKIYIVIATFSGMAGVMAQLGVFIAGAYLAMNGSGITPGVVLVFVNLMNFVLEPIGVLPGVLAGRRAALALVDKMLRLLKENTDTQKHYVVDCLQEGIQIRDLSFAYQEGEKVLRNINLEFEKGKSYAIVGASGSGKSTLLHLLLAAYGQYEGSISYDGHEVRDIEDASLYDKVSVIQQNVMIFNASVRENITMFKDMPEELVKRVIEMAGLSMFVKEHGQDYLCGEGGNLLSGGEKQRISIARSLLRNASVLLVDEATAALDRLTAHQVADSILDVEGMTKIVVTHDLEENILKRYDEIIVLKAGEVVEKGDYYELKQRGGYFYSLYTLAQ